MGRQIVLTWRMAAAVAGGIALAGCGNAGQDASTAAELAGRSGPPAGAAVEPAPQAKAYSGPVAFTVVADGLSAAFTDQSKGQVARQEWDFGDGATSIASAPIHAYSRVGMYQVTEKIVAADGQSSGRTVAVRVMPFPPELRNGAVRGSLSAVATYELHFYARPPLGATHLDVELSGPAGQADLYVKFGSVPTDDSFDCHVALEGKPVRCLFDTPRAGPYYARVLARKSFADASLKASWNEAVAAAAGK
jgi:hypothetical protein